MSALATLLAPLDSSVFLQDLLQRQAHHWQTSSALHQHLREFVTHDRLPSLLPRLESLSVWFRSRTNHLKQMTASPSQAMALYQAGMTLYGTFAPDQWPELADVFELGHSAARELGLPEGSFRLSFFATPRGGHTRLHFDNADGITMQLHGVKRWSLAPATIDLPPTNHVVGDPSDIALHAVTRGPFPTELPDSALAVTMTPGSMLYIPRGAWHATWTDEDSLSLDFNFASRFLWKEVIGRAVDQLVSSLPAARRPAVAAPEAAPQLDQILDHLRASLATLDARALLPPTSPRPTDARLRWNPLATFFVEELKGSRARVIFRAFRMPTEFTEATVRTEWLPVLDSLREGTAFDAATLEARSLPPREVSALLDLLWQDGIVLQAS